MHSNVNNRTGSIENLLYAKKLFCDMRLEIIFSVVHACVSTNKYSAPDCHDLLLDRGSLNRVDILSSNIDRCLWDRFKPSDSTDSSWFRCVTRRPSGTSGFTPNSLKAVLSRVVGDARHMEIAQRVDESVCGDEAVLVPYYLLRFHALNVCKVNMLMGDESTIHKYSIIHQLITADCSEGEGDTLWHLVNVVGKFHVRHMRQETRTFISAALDAWLLRKIEPSLSNSMQDTFQKYWNSMIKHMDGPFIRDVDEDVGQALIEFLGEIYSSNLRLDAADLLRKLDGIRGRIERLDNLL